MRIRDKIINFILKILGEVPKVDTVSNSEEIPKKVEEVSKEEKNKEKYFGKKSILDEIKRLELEIVPLKVYSLEKYKLFKSQLEDITKKCNLLYEDQTKKNQYTFTLTIGISPEEDIQIHKSLYELSESIRQYKRQEFNYEASLKSLSELKNMLIIIHQKLIAQANIKDLICAYKRLDEIINEVCSVDVESNTLKQEEVCKSMCECIYIFLKCNALCDNYFKEFAFEEYYQKEYVTFCEIFVSDISSLLQKTEIMQGTKYYSRYNTYLNNLLLRENARKNILLDKNFIKSFVQVEKKIFELHYYYSKKLNLQADTSLDIINITDLNNYVKDLYLTYQEDVNVGQKLFLFMIYIENFKFDITSYEVYKLVYFFGLKTFFIQYLKNVDKDELMKNIFKLQKTTKITPLSKSEKSGSLEFFKLADFQKSEIDIEILRKLLSRLNINFKEIQSEEIICIYISNEFFNDCKLILKNLNELERYS